MTDPAVPASDGSPANGTASSSTPPAASGVPPLPPQPQYQQPPQYQAPSGSAPPYGLAPAPVPPASAAPGAGWVQPVYAAAPPKGLSLTSMILGLVSILFFWTFVCPLLGLIFAILGYKKEPAGRGFAITGLVLNGIMLLIPVSFILITVLSGLAVLGTAATVPH